MVDSCMFCQIVRGESWSSKVFEDDRVLAFLSNRPVNVGHTLVVPKKHYESIFDISEEEFAHLFVVVKRIAAAVKTAVAAEGVRIIQNNGEAAGQVIFHLHVHVTPFKEKVSLQHYTESRSRSDLEEDAAMIIPLVKNQSSP